MDTRQKILAAAADILQEGGPSLSVRAVAARAGVGASTLRHYFPTQRALFDTVLTAIYDHALPDGRIRDVSVPARERLVERLWQTLEPIGTDSDARRTWATVYTSFIAPEASEDSRKGYVVLERQAQQRVVAWLAILVEEGALPAGDNARRADFLLTVVDGLSIARALPSTESRLASEAATLATAVEAVFRLP